MAIKLTSPKPFLGAQITNTKVLSSKIDEIIVVVNDLTDGTINETNLNLSGTLDVDGISTLGATTPVSVSAAGIVTIASVIDATTKDTGSIITEGGIGVEKAVFAGTSLTATTTVNAGTLVLSGNGAVGAPAHSFTARPTQGMYSISASQVGLSNGAAGLNLVVDATGISTDSTKMRVPLGTTPVGTVSIVEYATGRDFVTELTLTNFIVGTIPGIGALGVGNIAYAFPAGQHFELVSSLSSIILTVPGTTVSTDTGLGSVIASGAIATLTTAAFEDRLTGQTVSAEVAGGAAVSALTAATAGVGTGISLNVAASVKNVFLNSAGTWNADNAGNLTATGTIVLKWSKM